MSQAPSGDVLPPPFVIRSYRPSDRDACAGSVAKPAFLGQPIDPVFEDRELFADFLTNYYLAPRAGIRLRHRTRRRGARLPARLPLPAAQPVLQFSPEPEHVRHADPTRYRRYNAASRRFVHWIFLNGWREVPAAPRRTAHFHINLLPDARSITGTRALIDAFLEYLTSKGEKRVYGQMVSFANRRGEKMFQRYGFQVLNRMEITKYRRLHPEPVYLCTVVKDLEKNSKLYAEN